ncbi:MAG: ATP-binding cassette domain-containing protein [Nocardioidaceae bacterium]
MSTVASQTIQSVISYDRVTKYFRSGGTNVLALHEVDLAIRRNEFVSIVGPSGCGKTTLIRLCAGFDRPTEGRTLYDGRTVRGINTDVGYVTQDSNLYPWMTLRGNVEFPLRLRGIPAEERGARSEAYLNMAGLQGFEESYPYQLSGGMQKRGSMIRTMIYDPDVLLMDEPFAALDAQTRMLLQSDLLRIWSQRRKTIVFVTHDLSEAIALSDTVVVMSARPGTVKRVFNVPIGRPRNVFQIHDQEGYMDVYSEIWRHLGSEVVQSAEGVRPGSAALPPPLEKRAPRASRAERRRIRRLDAGDAGHDGEAHGGRGVAPHRSGEPLPGSLRSSPRVGFGVRVNVLRVLAAAAFLGLWQAGASFGLLNPLVFSSPVKVAQELWSLFVQGEVLYGHTIYQQIAVTFEEMIIGYGVGGAIGLVVGYALGRSELFSRAFEPYILAIYAVPKIALAPVFVLILGIGLVSKVGIVAAEVFFMVFFNTYGGVRGVHPEYVQLARIMGASKPQTVRSIVLPAALPSIVLGFKMGLPLAMIGAIVGEFVASDKGLGWFILYSAANFQASGLFSAIIILIVIVWGLSRLLALLERHLLRWQASQQQATVQF